MPRQRSKKERTCIECGKIDIVRCDYPRTTCLRCSIRLRGPIGLPERGQRITAKSPSLEIGRAAEYLVCADLILQGYPAFLAAPGLPYDVVVEARGALLRLQVKATLQPKPIPQRAARVPAYQFSIRRCGSGGRRAYSSSEFDGYALVGLDTRLIAYLPFHHGKQTIHLRLPGSVPAKNAARRESMDGFPWEALLLALDVKAQRAEAL